MNHYGVRLPIIYGANRVTGTLVWYGDFRVREHKPGGGRGSGNQPSFTYSTSFNWKKTP